MQQLIPVPTDPSGEIDVHEHYATDWLETGGVRANFVCSADGAATAAGKSRGLQTEGDTRIFAVLRDLADVVLVGASTARAEQYRPPDPAPDRRALRKRFGLAEAPDLAVMSASLDLNLDDVTFHPQESQGRTLVIAGSNAPLTRRNDLIDLAAENGRVQLLEQPADPDGGIHISSTLEELRALGYRRILLEGGPRLFSAAITAGVVDELCLSISPMVVGPAGQRIVDGEDWPVDFGPQLSLTGLLSEDGALFCRYRLHY